jgi:hypothetical protein
MGASILGNEARAMDTLVEKVICLGIEKGVSFLDFGHSNENSGQYLIPVCINLNRNLAVAVLGYLSSQ